MISCIWPREVKSQVFNYVETDEDEASFYQSRIIPVDSEEVHQYA